ncbi:MAG: DUF2062 domain-containing protein [Polyangiales bacterium]
MSWLRNRIDRIRSLWRAALEENEDPRKFAFSVAVGVTVSASPVPPVLGLRSFAAVGSAWLTRCSKLTSFLACHVCVGPIWIALAILQVRVGSFILQRPSPSWGTTAAERIDAARHALAAWWIGGVLVSPLVGLVAYLIALPIAKRYRARKLQRQQSVTASVRADSGS